MKTSTKLAPALMAFAAVLVATASGCTARSPASPVLPGPQGNLPADTVPAVADFNPSAYVATARLAAANMEVTQLKAAASAYVATHVGTAGPTSDDLGDPGFANLKAWYRFDLSGRITRVDAVPNGWTGIVFSLSQQRWVSGQPDNNHLADQDIP